MAHTILLAEDEENDVFFFKMALQKAGLEVQLHVAPDGRAVLDYFEGKGKYEDRMEFPLPQLVFLDLKLPKVMGLEVLRLVRERPELTPVILILSASCADEDVANAYRLGANGYLVKPADVSELTGMVSSAYQFWLRHNTVPPGIPSWQFSPAQSQSAGAPF